MEIICMYRRFLVWAGKMFNSRVMGVVGVMGATIRVMVGEIPIRSRL
jgi:hypothetical protein